MTFSGENEMQRMLEHALQQSDGILVTGVEKPKNSRGTAQNKKVQGTGSMVRP
jgi:hypothetical protein